ncbi:hypothetical protein ABZ791_16110 [Streptomyces huasconensis]|uniref:Extensin n=1 Tax=Streptomyces huasconensis TaxID=1854574 RepID=A0ABV3LNB7_9ACTN
MADEQDKWLDRDAAERLLRGEPLEDVDPHARAAADRLAQALGALAAGDGSATRAQTDATPGTTSGAAPGELPGEAAALAAFRAAKAAKATRAASAQPGPRSGAYATPAHEAAAVESVRMSRAGARPQPSRWGRPVRFGLAAALAGCMVGGVAVAAGSGVLPSPFGRHDEPRPAASASPVDTTEAPSVSPSDGTGESGESPEGTENSEGSVGSPPQEGTVPGDEHPHDPEDGTPPDAASGGDHTDDATRRPADDGTPRRDGGKGLRRKVIAACRDYRSGELRGDRRRHLEEAAKGSARLEEFCGRVLGGRDGGRGGGGGQGNGDGQGGGKSGDGGGGENHGDGGEGSGGSGGGDTGGGSGGGDTGGAPAPAPPPALPGPVPTGSYSALPHLP